MTIGEWHIYDLDTDDARAILGLPGIASLTSLKDPDETGERRDRWRVESADIQETDVERLNRFIMGLVGSDLNFFLKGPAYTKDEKTGIVSGS